MNTRLKVSESDLFQVISKKLGEKEAKLLIKYVNSKIEENNGSLVQCSDLDKAKIELIQNMNENSSKLSDKIHKSHVNILTWTIVLWVTILGFTISVVFLK